MKKLFAIILAIILMLSIVGCGTQTNISANSTNTTESNKTTTATTSDVDNIETNITNSETMDKLENVDKNTTTDIEKPTVPTTPEPILQITPNELEFTGKTLNTYGDVDSELAKELEKVLKNYNKNISLSCWRTDGSLAITYNTNQTYFSACTIKMPVMLYCCKLIDEGKINKDTLLTYQEKHYHGGSGKIRYQKYGTQYTVEYLINQGLSISDNVAYEMIVDYIGHDGFNNMLKELGCDSLIVPNWSIWASYAKTNDFIKVWNAVNEYFKTDTIGAKILKTACTNTPFNYGSKAIKEYEYSHKSGDNFGTNCVYNDAGIIWAEVPYVYAIFTKSEGEWVDSNTVDNVMKLVNQIMTKGNNTSLQ